MDSLQLQLTSALQRFNALQRRAETQRESPAVLAKTLAELGTALEEVRVVQEQLIESRTQMERLHLELRSQSEKYWRLFDEMPQPYVVSRSDSTIVEANKAAAQLFNVSQRFLTGKTLSIFVCEGRGEFLATCAQAAAEEAVLDFSFKIRPRERAPLTVHTHLSGGADGLRWVFRTAPPVSRPPDDATL